MATTPTETVTLRNRTPRMLPPILIPHADVCAASGTCSCQQVRVGVARKGAKGVRAVAVVSRRLPTTLTLCANGTEGDAITGLHLAVLHAPAIKALIASRAITATRVPVPAEATTTPPAEAAPVAVPVPEPVVAVTSPSAPVASTSATTKEPV